jgi:hypothetical protein
LASCTYMCHAPVWNGNGIAAATKWVVTIRELKCYATVVPHITTGLGVTNCPTNTPRLHPTTHLPEHPHTFP